MISEDLGVDLALDAFRRLMASLQVARAQRGADPWSDCPMTMPQLRALSLIVAARRGLSSRELAVSLGVGASAITPMVDHLVAGKGDVLREALSHLTSEELQQVTAAFDVLRAALTTTQGRDA